MNSEGLYLSSSDEKVSQNDSLNLLKTEKK